MRHHAIRRPLPGLGIVASALVMAAICFAASSTRAALLPIGSAILSSPVPGLAGGGLLVANSGSVPFSSATFSGTLTSQVFLNDPANPFGPGNATFTYQLTNNPGPHDEMGRMTVSGYGVPGLLTDASYQLAPAGVAPTSFDRSATANLGDVIGESFTAAPLGLGVLHPGDSSTMWVVHTSTPLFNNSIASVIDGSTMSVPTYAPLFVPEPSMAFLALIGMGAILRRRSAR